MKAVVSRALLGISAVLATPAAAQADMAWVGARLSGVFIQSGMGDIDGFGSMMMQLDTSANKICYSLNARKIGLATTAKLHVGEFRSEGPIVMPLDVTGIRNTSCTKADPELIRKLIEEPQTFYVVIHNRQFPDGALRGQLEKR